MKSVEFHINYHTQWGESLLVHYAIDNEQPSDIALTTHDGVHWHGSIAIAPESQTIRHTYCVATEDGRIHRRESNHWRLFHINHRSRICFSDVWMEHQPSALFHRSIFTSKSMLHCRHNESAHPLLTAPYLLIVTAPPLPDGHTWAIAGSTVALGKWQENQALQMQRISATEWAAALDGNDIALGFSYKMLLVNANGSSPVWETGDNRLFEPLAPSEQGQCATSVVRFDSLPRGIVPQWKAAGVVMPLFSLKSQHSWGVGDMNDLLAFIRWASDCGMKAIQLLPINDTTTNGTWRDSYPYNCVSVFALHPIYLSPEEWPHSRAYGQCQKEGARINQSDEMDYEAAYALKMRFAHALYRELGESITDSDAFRSFCREESAWLDDYAAFCTLRNFYHTANFRAWPSQSTDAYGMTEDMQFHKFVQFLLHRQMLKAHTVAQELGILIKGDIPIGISPDSVPAWKDGRLFHFNGQAGAPPDDFATRGQNWGFPTYDWEAMSADGYSWWRRRLAHMSRYFDAYRIDHVLGFFRIWEVPKEHIYGVMGHFRPALPLSEAEIRSFGFTLPMEWATRPVVSGRQMDELCHQFGEDIRCRFFEATPHGNYALRPEHESQRAIQQLDIAYGLKEALCDIATEVLFISDPDHPHLYHPRVSAQLTRRFSQMPPNEREAFNRLHDHFFYFRHNEFWEKEAMRKMPAIVNYAIARSQANEEEQGLSPLGHTGMLPCAEDLGMVPACVKGVLERLDILSLEIQRMPKSWGRRFGRLADNPYLSVATIATHDMPPLRSWWKENAEQTSAFWHEALGHDTEAPSEATPEVCEEVVKAHLESPSMLCLLSFQDLTAISASLRSKHPEKEQINVPSNPNQYWRYRMHISLEQLLQDSGFSEKLRLLIQQSGR